MKTYKGSEIIKKVEDKEIKNGAKIKSDDGDIFTYIADDSTFYWGKSVGGERVPIYTFLNHTFELIEDEVDIDNIEELDKCKFRHGNTISYQESKFIDKVNELVQVVKQLDKRVKELEEFNIEISEKDINEAINKAREQRNKEIKSIKEK